MKLRSIAQWLAVGLATGTVGADPGRVPEVDAPAVAHHVARAKEIGGDEFDFLADGFVCRPAANAIIDAIRDIPGFLDPNAPGVEPFAAFDNFYYVGLYAIGSWILDTGDGLILFDALNNEGEARNILIPGMLELGLDPTAMNTVVITHAHFDHYGGSDYLAQQYGARIAMSGSDWDALENDIALPFALRAGYPAVTQPTRDRVIEDGETIEMGNASVTFVVTPGHTAGTLSSIITVRYQGEELTIGMWGGQALPGRFSELNQMHNSLHKFWDIARERGVEALISTHPWVWATSRCEKNGAGWGRTRSSSARRASSVCSGSTTNVLPRSLRGCTPAAPPNSVRTQRKLDNRTRPPRRGPLHFSL